MSANGRACRCFQRFRRASDRDKGRNCALHCLTNMTNMIMELLDRLRRNSSSGITDHTLVLLGA